MKNALYILWNKRHLLADTMLNSKKVKPIAFELCLTESVSQSVSQSVENSSIKNLLACFESVLKA